MKKFILICAAALLVFSSVCAYAQTDVRSLNKVSRQTLVSLLGNPTDKWTVDDYWDADHLNSLKKKVEICVDKNGGIIYFYASSNKFCLLSDLFSGGIKVGDNISKVKSYDFVNCKYGKGKAGNALFKESELYNSNASVHKNWYFALHDEYHFIQIQTDDNGIIKKIGVSTHDEWLSSDHSSFLD